MSNFEIESESYVIPTPGGVFYATSSPKKDAARSVIFKLLSNESSHRLTLNSLNEITGIENEQDALELIYRMQNLDWLQKESTVRKAPEGILVELLPTLLPSLSGSQKALLADPQGFYLATHGFSHETAEELSALSADLASLSERHSGLLYNNIGLNSSAWAIVDGSANGKLGFWPLYIGNNRFVLVLSGMPQLNQANLVNLIWALNKRYSD